MSQLQHDHLFLGVDGGASKIRVVILNERSEVLFEQSFSQGANYQALDVETVVANLEMAIQAAVDALGLRPVVFDWSVFGLAGCNFESDKQLLTDALRKSSLSTILGGGFEVINDGLIALRAGTEDGVGVVVISGTGSNCLARTAEGQVIQSGGWNHILADEGSGYDIGLRTLRVVVQSLDGRGGETALTKAVFNHLQVNSLESLYKEVYANLTTKAQVASLAKLTIEMAEKRDAEAQDILNHSVNELLQMIDAVLRQLEWRDASVPVVAVGSMINDRNYVRQRLQVELLRVAPRARLIKPRISSAMGAALLALEHNRNVA